MTGERSPRTPYRSVNEPSVLAYAAGIFDGEGSVSIVKYRRKHRNAYSLIADVVNTDPRVTEWLYRNFGGGVLLKQHIPGRRPLFHWQLSGSGASEFLRDVQPFLIVKREKAIVALSIPFDTAGGQPMPKDREAAHLAMKDLNGGSNLRPLYEDIEQWLHQGDPHRETRRRVFHAQVKTCLGCGSHYHPRRRESPRQFADRSFCRDGCARRANGLTAAANLRLRWATR